MRLQHLHKRRGYWYYIRRVPDRARPVDPRKWINKTTGIRIADDPRGICSRWSSTLNDSIAAGSSRPAKHDRFLGKAVIPRPSAWPSLQTSRDER